MLSGAGGDELFGGYPWRYYRAVVNDDFEHYVDKYYDYWQRLVDEETMPRLLAPVWPDVADLSTRDVLRDVFPVHPEHIERPEDYVNLSLYLEARTFLHGLLLVEDKLSMAHGLETRLPFLDNELVEFAQSLPVQLKLGQLDEVVRVNENEPGHKTERFYRRTGDGKILLRRAMGRHLPEVAVTRPRSRASAARTRAGSAARASTTCAARSSATRASTSGSTPAPCARSSTITSAAARTGGC